jgi:hypothetical protein
MRAMHATTQLIGFTLGLSLNRLEPIHATTQLSGMQLTPCLSPHANIKWAKPLVSHFLHAKYGMGLPLYFLPFRDCLPISNFL